MIKVRYSDHLVIGTGIATQASFSRNSHNIVVWGMQSSIPQARSRVSEQRSRTYSTCSSSKLTAKSACGTIHVNRFRPAMLCLSLVSAPRIQVATKPFLCHQSIDCLKQIALRRQCRRRIIRIEKSHAPHRLSPKIMPSGSELARMRGINYFSRCP